MREFYSKYLHFMQNDVVIQDDEKGEIVGFKCATLQQHQKNPAAPFKSQDE